MVHIRVLLGENTNSCRKGNSTRTLSSLAYPLGWVTSTRITITPSNENSLPIRSKAKQFEGGISPGVDGGKGTSVGLFLKEDALLGTNGKLECRGHESATTTKIF